jgi:thermitase
MLVRWLVSFSLGVALLSPASRALAQSVFPHGSHIAGELLIGPKEGVSDDDLENLYKGHGGKKIKSLSQIKVHHVKVPEHELEKVEAALRKNPKIGFVEKNFIAESTLAPNDPSYPTQWHLAQISTPGAWDISTGSSGVIIAVLDSGIDTQHPDLPNVVAGRNFIIGTTNVYDNGVNYGHGTAVAGTAAAAGNNGIGVTGVSWRNSIMPLVVMDSSAYSPYSVIAAAINHAADNGAKVINMSLAGSSYSTTLQNAVNYAWNKGVVIVAAAANNGTSTPMYPAALENVLAVAATDSSDNRASFSNYGNWIDVAAPGVSVRTTMLGGGYGNWNGTSFATPQVAALAALLFSANPNLTNTQVVSLIKSNADDLGALGFDQYFGNGRINAYRTLAAAVTSGTPPPPPSSILKAYYLGVTGQDKVGPLTFIGNGNADFHIQVQGLRGTPTRIRVSSDVGGIWENPYNGANWIVLGQYDGAGNGDLWFEPWASNSFRVKVWYSDGTTDEASAVNQTTTVPPPPPPAPTSDTTAPTVSIASVQVDGRWLTLNASASDSQSGVTKVELYADGKLQATDTSKPYTFKINIKQWSNGSHQIQVKAYDGAGNVGTSATSITKN